MLLHGSSSAASRSARVRVVLLASIAALVVTTFEVNAAPAVRARATTGDQLAAADGDDFSSRRRVRGRRGDAAGLAMMGMMIGTMGAIIASQRRDRHRHVYYGYHGHPYGYGHGYTHPHVYHQPYAYHAPRAYHRHHVLPPSVGVHIPNYYDRYQRVDPHTGANVSVGVPRVGF
jgi:hypothetical protein